ncbi:MAG: hypothetical protein CL609_01075 [Anaerolineaceae bacterium]|nr:hypothetical protein [Anaerolineaceae bacterium]
MEYIIIVWVLSIVVTIYWLIRYRELSDTARAIWVLVILLFPFLGCIAALLATMDKRRP